MSALRTLGLALLVALGAASAVLASRIVEAYARGGALRLELGRARLLRLEPELDEALAALDEELVLTYYVSGREHMPSDMRRVEAGVTDLLVAVAAAAPPGRVEWRIVDPEVSPDLARYAARRRVAPFRRRSVTRDAWSERTIWSTLTIALGAHEEARVHGIGPEHLPRLQDVLRLSLARVRAPARPTVALAAPPGYAELRAALAERARVVDVPLDALAALPDDVDLLFWMEPRTLDAARLVELERWLAGGRSLVVADDAYVVDERSLLRTQDGVELTLAPAQRGVEPLFAHLGLAPRDALLLDGYHERVHVGDDTSPAPFAVRCIAPNQDFTGYPDQPNGMLMFGTPFVLDVDAARLRELGLTARALASSSHDTWVVPPPVPPRPPLALEPFPPPAAERVAKQPLLLALEPDDPWHGTVVVATATTPFADGSHGRPGTAHWRLVRALVDGLGSDERQVARRTGALAPDPIPALTAGERALLRLLVVLLVPAALALGAWLRRRPGRRHERGRPVLVALAPRLALVPVAIVLAHAAGALGLELDATAEGWNRLAPETRALAARVGNGGPVRAELVLTPRERLPAALRDARARVRDLLARLGDAGLPLDVVETDPDALDEEGLARRGVTARRVTTRDEEVVTVRSIVAGLRLERDGRAEVVPLEGAAALEELEFRVAFALHRLATGAPTRVAFVPDVPRLSAAERYEYYQAKGLFAPIGGDVHADARARLVDAGFEVLHVDPREPELPSRLDALVWLQPRRSIERLLALVVRHLHGGGRALIAAQHFEIQPRQYRGADFDVVHWPRPNSPDLELLWLPELGVELVRDVVFDARCASERVAVQQSGRDGARSFETQDEALPFLVRTAAANASPDSPVTAHLGDLVLPYPSRIRWDERRLAAHGLVAETLLTTGPRTWSYAWSGGWLPRERLEGPAGEDDVLGRQPLLVRFTGTFPVPAVPMRLDWVGDAPPDPPPPPLAEDALPWPEPAPGELLLLGDAVCFRDGRLDDPDSRADHLLLSSVAHLALPPELAAIAARRRVAGGFDWVPPEERAWLRAKTVGAGPLALLLFGGLLALVRRRRVA